MAFSGKATYDNFTLIGEDVSPLVVNFSPFETPFLDLLPAPAQAGKNIYHQWTEEQLGPDIIIASAAVNSATAATGILINGLGAMLQAGMLLEMQTNTSAQANEILQITSAVGANSVLVTRAFGGTTQNSLVAGGTLHVLGSAELEGSTSSGDVTRPRTRRGNYFQIFKKVITISGSDRAVTYAPDLGDEFDHQTALRTRELMRDLEKVVFRGRTSGNSIGSASAYRTMDGLTAFLTTINSTIVQSSFAADPLLYTNNLLQQAWNGGARDIDIIVAGAQWKRDLSGAASTSRLVTRPQEATRIVQHVEYLETDFGVQRLVLSPWLRSGQMMGVSSNRVRVVPLQGRSFQRQMIAKTGDSDVAHVVGEYTLEVHQPASMFQATI